ncbi:MAG: sodium:solute symporter family protein [Sedimentisphaerales bacterium]
MCQIDWLIVIAALLVVLVIGLYTKRYMKDVSDFLAGGRVAGRYVVAVAGTQIAMGIIGAIAMFELHYKSGFAIQFWWGLYIPISLVITLTGFAIYRYRETRAMTLAQFFEIRYSKRFRIFTGILQAVSGIINYGIFPAVSARFLMYFCNLPVSIEILGLSFPTFALIMAIFLSFALLLVATGGQVTIMTTDCIQGIIGYPLYLIVVIAILVSFSWSKQMAPVLLDRPAGMSMLNPFDVQQLRDFNIFFILVNIFSNIYNMMSWSGTQGYSAAAITPHEQKMGKILGTWREGCAAMLFVLLPIAAYTYFHHPDFSNQATATTRQLSWKVLEDVAPNPSLSSLPPTDETIRHYQTTLSPKQKQVYNTLYHQMLVPAALRDTLPMGVLGIFCAIMIFRMIGIDTAYMHSWGSIIVQDIILPFRKTPFTTRQQLFLLRLVITLVAMFAFFFSLLYGQVTYILMFMSLTGSIWLGGAGAVIIGGLYWRRGTAAGAWAALLTGATCGITGFVGMNYWANWIYPALEKFPKLLAIVTNTIEGFSGIFEPLIKWEVRPQAFPINGQEIYFITMALSIIVYIVVSLLTCRQPFNLDKMLHRGKYRIEGGEDSSPIKPPRSLKALILSMLGIDKQFTRGDKIISWSVFLYSMGWGFGTWLIVLLWNVCFGQWPKNWWSTWFFIQYIVVGFIIGAITTVWFTVGGIIDLRKMFQNLAKRKVNALDNGRVIDHTNADDIAVTQPGLNATNSTPNTNKDI